MGKVGLPDSLLKKQTELTQEEREQLKKRTYIGDDTLLRIMRDRGADPFLHTAAKITFAHHEKWDGTGYPFGLAGDMIPLPARIVAIADLYDGLTRLKHGREPVKHQKAITIINNMAGSALDPEIVNAFNGVADRMEQIAKEGNTRRQSA